MTSPNHNLIAEQLGMDVGVVKGALDDDVFSNFSPAGSDGWAICVEKEFSKPPFYYTAEECYEQWALTKRKLKAMEVPIKFWVDANGQCRTVYKVNPSNHECGLTTPQAFAKRWEVDLAWVFTKCKDGTLRAKLKGGRWLIEKHPSNWLKARAYRNLTTPTKEA